jgi:two-component system, chemotaxis family, sensor kinase Cph1
MTSKKNNPLGCPILPISSIPTLDTARLRQHAEEAFKLKKPNEMQALSPEETGRIFHELQVHQIELEMQNEELQLAQRELDAAKVRYFDLYDLAPVGYCTISQKGVILEANLTASTLLNVSRSELVSKPFSRFIFKDEQDFYYLNFKRVLNTGKPLSCELRMLRSDSLNFWARLELTASPGSFKISDKQVDNEPLIRLTISDITDSKLAQEALRQSNIALEDFVHVASHDLQEPLRKVMTFGERLIAIGDRSLNDQERDYIARMQHAANRMRSLITDLVKYSKVTSDHSALKILNLKRPVEDAVKDLILLFEENGVSIEIGTLPDVKANETAMRQLFQNLISNSIKYRSDQKPIIKIYHAPSDNKEFHEIHIVDNGIGFDEEFLEKIFKPFQRLHAKDSLYSGTGMGLAICHKIVELHCGSITARSKPGEGSTFIVRLPKNIILNSG